MKASLKIFPLIITILISSHFVEAQFSLDIKVGLNITNRNYSGFPLDIKTNSSTTGSVGVITYYNISQNLILGSGICFIGIRGKIVEPIESDSRIDYLKVPLSLNYQMGNILFGIGAYYAYGIGGKNEDNGQNLKLSLGESNTDHFSPEDFGLFSNLSFKIESWRIFIEYALGLKNINPTEIKEVFTSIDTSNTYIGFGVSRKIK